MAEGRMAPTRAIVPPVRARDFARAILEADTVAGKLAPPPAALVLDDPEPPCLVAAPRRPAGLEAVHHRKVAVPPRAGLRDPAQRARILHALANHELQAIELFAWALLAFPAAPRPFRAGLVAILADEQRHLALYDGRLRAHGLRFGDLPVTAHFWNRLPPPDPLHFVCTMGLTFEQANLDFAGDYAAAARAAGDAETAAVLEQVHADEIGHVRFAWIWLGKLAPGADPWATYRAHVLPPLGPARARGARLDVEARRRAGLSEAFLAELAAVPARRPGGGPR
jgi:uncharacterized ferritin-like protein (DUF455 family)